MFQRGFLVWPTKEERHAPQHSWLHRGSRSSEKGGKTQRIISASQVEDDMSLSSLYVTAGSGAIVCEIERCQLYISKHQAQLPSRDPRVHQSAFTNLRRHPEFADNAMRQLFTRHISLLLRRAYVLLTASSSTTLSPDVSLMPTVIAARTNYPDRARQPPHLSSSKADSSSNMTP